MPHAINAINVPIANKFGALTGPRAQWSILKVVPNNMNMKPMRKSIMGIKKGRSFTNRGL